MFTFSICMNRRLKQINRQTQNQPNNFQQSHLASTIDMDTSRHIYDDEIARCNDLSQHLFIFVK